MKAKGLLLITVSTGLVFLGLSVMSFSRGGESSAVRKYYSEARKNNNAIDALLQEWEKLETEQQELGGRHSSIIDQSNDYYREANNLVKGIKDPELKALVEKKLAASQLSFNAKAAEVQKQNQDLARMQQERADHEIALMLVTSMSELAKGQQGIKADAAKLNDLSKKHEEIKARAKELIK